MLISFDLPAPLGPSGAKMAPRSAAQGDLVQRPPTPGRTGAVVDFNEVFGNQGVIRWPGQNRSPGAY